MNNFLVLLTSNWPLMDIILNIHELKRQPLFSNLKDKFTPFVSSFYMKSLALSSYEFFSSIFQFYTSPPPPPPPNKCGVFCGVLFFWLGGRAPAATQARGPIFGEGGGGYKNCQILRKNFLRG